MMDDEVAVVYTAVAIVTIIGCWPACKYVFIQWLRSEPRRSRSQYLDPVVLGTFAAELGTPIGSDSVVIGIAVAEDRAGGLAGLEG